MHEAALYDLPEMVLERDSAGVLKAALAPLPDGVMATFRDASRRPGDDTDSRQGRRPDKLVAGITWRTNLRRSRYTHGSCRRSTSAYGGNAPQKNAGMDDGAATRSNDTDTIRHIDFAAEKTAHGSVVRGLEQRMGELGRKPAVRHLEPMRISIWSE